MFYWRDENKASWKTMLYNIENISVGIAVSVRNTPNPYTFFFCLENIQRNDMDTQSNIDRNDVQWEIFNKN